MDYGIWNLHNISLPNNNIFNLNNGATSASTFDNNFILPLAIFNQQLTPSIPDLDILVNQQNVTSQLLAQDLNSDSAESSSNDSTNTSLKNGNEGKSETNDHNSTNLIDTMVSDLNNTINNNDLSNACDDNAVDNQLEMKTLLLNQQTVPEQISLLAQHFIPVYNLVLNHLNNQQNYQVSETGEETCSLSDDELEKNDEQTSKQTEINTEISIPSVELLSKTNQSQQKLLMPTNAQINNLDDNENKNKISKKNQSTQRVRYEREEYHCTMCSYTCTTEKAFIRHLTFHTLGKDEVIQNKISCAICGRDRNDESAMAKHMKKHRDGRYFCCDICVFKTVQLKKLIQHRRMHTGEKPHLCPRCSYRSTRRDNLRSHIRRVHKQDNFFGDTFNPRGILLTPRKNVISINNETTNSSLIETNLITEDDNNDHNDNDNLNDIFNN